MNMKILLTSAFMLPALFPIHMAYAQKEAIGMFYELKLAPVTCKWTNVADSKKLDAQIAGMEKGLGISGSDRTGLMKQTEADIKSDPSNCAVDGMLHSMYDEAVK